ncbi:hypothetical protein H310_13734 [Aphanomyces invadans]|nr:hypothetical protein H310_13734 [Aphanomyces invadans]ETV91655.1 hypothetical protein H310_13734 [Aphanomyces invadans]|eukprot:XP_008879581.1 hypothetical protein H310_13734 [Aphanomyces invadans]
MAESLEDELARFQAEIASLEAGGSSESTPVVDSAVPEAKAPTKRPLENGDIDLDEVARKRQKAIEVANKLLKAAAAAPTPQPAPFRPAPTVIVRAPTKRVDKPPVEDPLSSSYVAPTIQHGALRMDLPSSTPNVSIMHGQSLPMGAAVQMEPMIDHKTGLPLSTKEQLIFNQQQSVYRYKPQHNFTATHQAPSDKKFLRAAAGKVWEDATLAEWPENDFRLFCGDLGNEVTDELLSQAFAAYASFAMARVVRDKITHVSKGFGFVSFLDGLDAMKAMREMNGKYIGNRPVKITKGKWQERALEVVKKKKKGGKKNRHLF